MTWRTANHTHLRVMPSSVPSSITVSFVFNSTLSLDEIIETANTHLISHQIVGASSIHEGQVCLKCEEFPSLDVRVQNHNRSTLPFFASNPLAMEIATESDIQGEDMSCTGGTTVHAFRHLKDYFMGRER